MDLPTLALPSFPYRIAEREGKLHIFDEIRRKFLLLTPEEWVRQHVVNLLAAHYAYPRSLMQLEGGLHYGKLAKRTDIVVLNRQAQPFMLVECKAPHIPISVATVEQISRYNKVLQAPYLLLSNGLKTICFQIDNQGKVQQLGNLPAFPA